MKAQEQPGAQKQADQRAEPVAKASAEARRLRPYMRTGSRLKKPDYDRYTITIEPVEPNEEE
jgi:hypothetical protein